MRPNNLILLEQDINKAFKYETERTFVPLKKKKKKRIV